MNKKIEKTLKVVSLLGVGVAIGILISEILQKMKENENVDPDFENLEDLEEFEATE